MEGEATLNVGFNPGEPSKAFASVPEGLEPTRIVATEADRAEGAIEVDVTDDVAEAEVNEADADEAICAGDADVSETSDTRATATAPVKSSRFSSPSIVGRTVRARNREAPLLPVADPVLLENNL